MKREGLANDRVRSSVFAYMRNTSASTAVMFSLAMPAVMATTGVAIDFSIYSLKLTKLQAAADQSAIAAVKELAVVNSKAATVTQAAEGFARSILGNSVGSLAVAVDVGAKKDSVKITLTETWTPYFAQYIGAQVTPVVARATAKLAGTANVCILTLSPSDVKAFHMDKQAKVKANGCAIYSNSSHSQSIRLDQFSEISAALVCAVGGVKAKSTAVTPSPTTDCPVLPDPLSSRNEPAAGACKAAALIIKSGAATLDPGTYCGGIKISGAANVTFRAGNYIIKDGPFEISGSATVKSNNAAFYLKGELSVINFTGSTNIAMTGGTTGDMAGLLLFEDRSVSLDRVHRINSSNANQLTGTIYLSRGKLIIDPNSSIAQDSAYTAIIANQVEIDQGPTLVLNTDYSASNVPVPEGINLSSQVVLAN
jgi:Flp pilus assembly protein TadG